MFNKKDTKAKNADANLPTSFSQPPAAMTPASPKGAGGKGHGGSHTTLIAADTEITGDIRFTGLLEIEGAIVGNISADANSEAHVRIQESGKVEGDIRVPKVVINGDVKGTVLSSTLELAPKAQIEGNVHYNTIEMMKGAQVNGNLVHSAKENNPGRPSPKQGKNPSQKALVVD